MGIGKAEIGLNMRNDVFFTRGYKGAHIVDRAFPSFVFSFPTDTILAYIVDYHIAEGIDVGVDVFDRPGYENVTCIFEKGSGERIAEKLVEMINSSYN